MKKKKLLGPYEKISATIVSLVLAKGLSKTLLTLFKRINSGLSGDLVGSGAIASTGGGRCGCRGGAV